MDVTETSEICILLQIKYGIDSDSDDQPQRRTRGRQITYAESDDSEEVILSTIFKN